MTDTSKPLSIIERNNRIFAIVWILLQAFFCVMYGVYTHTASYNIFKSGGLYEYMAALGIALSAIIGLGGIMSYSSGLKWSGFGFAFLIVVMCFQYYFLVSGFWTKADIQNTNQTVTKAAQAQQNYGTDYIIYLSEAGANTLKTLGATATGAFKMGLTICIGFSAVIGRAGPLQILIFVMIGGFLYELNRQIISTVMYDVGGSTTIFMFGGIMGSIVALILSLTKQKQHIFNKQNYTSTRFNITMAFFGAAFFWVFFPMIFLDIPYTQVTLTSTNTLLGQNGMINAYYAISTCVVTSLALSALIHGRIRMKDLMYAPFAGAAIIATSSVHIFNPIVAILLGIIAGILQPLFNLAEQKMAYGKSYFSTCTPFLFAIQGILGALAAGILRAIKNNQSVFDFTKYPYPFRWSDNVSGFYRAFGISFGIAFSAGVVVGFLVFLISGQEQADYYQDRAYWILTDDGLRNTKVTRQVKEQDQIKGNHAYL